MMLASAKGTEKRAPKLVRTLFSCSMAASM